MALFEKFLVRQKKITCDSLLGSPCTILLLYNYFVLCKFLLPIRFRFKSGISAPTGERIVDVVGIPGFGVEE